MVLALPAVVIALILLVFAFAMVLLVEATIGRVLSGAPVIGGWLSGQVASAAIAAYNGLVSTIVSGCADLVSTFAFPIVKLHSLVDNLGAASAGALGAAQRIATVTIPTLSANLTSLAYWARDAAIAQAAIYQQQVVGLVWDRYDAVEADLATAIANLTSLAYWARDAAIAQAAIYQQQVVGLVWDRYDAVEAQLAALVGQVNAALQGLNTELEQQILQRWQQAEADATSAVQGAETRLGQAIDGVDQAAAARDAGLAATLGAAIATVQTAVQDIEQMPCIQECATLGPFGSMLDDLDLAAILALAGMALADPAGTVTFLEDEVVPIVTAAGVAARSVVGVAS